MKHPAEMTRREVVGALAVAAAAATVSWRETRPAVSASRVRPGAVVTLRCPGADAYALRFGDGEPRHVEAPGGRLVFEAPRVFAAATWTPIVVAPLADGRPHGEPAEVAVFTRRPTFGA